MCTQEACIIQEAFTIYFRSILLLITWINIDVETFKSRKLLLLLVECARV